MKIPVEGLGDVEFVDAQRQYAANGFERGRRNPGLFPILYGKGCYHPPRLELFGATPRAIELLYMAAQLQHEAGLIR